MLDPSLPLFLNPLETLKKNFFFFFFFFFGCAGSSLLSRLSSLVATSGGYGLAVVLGLHTAVVPLVVEHGR